MMVVDVWLGWHILDGYPIAVVSMKIPGLLVSSSPVYWTGGIPAEMVIGPGERPITTAEGGDSQVQNNIASS